MCFLLAAVVGVERGDGLFFDDFVSSGGKKQQRAVHHLRVADHALCGVEEIDEDFGRDVLGDQFVGIVSGSGAQIAGEPGAADVALDRGVGFELLHHADARKSPRNDQIHLQRRCGEHEAGNARCKVMHPGRRHDSANAVCHHHGAFRRQAVRFLQVVEKRVEIAHILHEARRMSATAR